MRLLSTLAVGCISDAKGRSQPLNVSNVTKKYDA